MLVIYTLNFTMMPLKKEDKVFTMASCMLSILDSLKLYDLNSLELGDGTLSEMMFRKMKGHGIDLNKELGFNHLEPIKKPKLTFKEFIIKRYSERYYTLSMVDRNKHSPHRSVEEYFSGLYAEYKILYGE